MLNKFLFPAPKPPNYTLESHKHNLFWLPTDSTNESSSIPCMFYSPEYSNREIEYFMIFCHGNGCDIGSMHYTLSEFSRHLNVYAISFEYPTYGLCTASSPNQETINNHAEQAFNFVSNTLNWPIERIIIYGHSIGSGAACYLASMHSIGALILQSPYTAINSLVREKAGVLSYLIRTRSWDNLEAMKHIQCPVLFIHGLDDTLIPPNHSQILYDACLNHERKKIILLRNEDHNSITEATLLRYITPFVEKQCKPMNTDIHLPVIKIDKQLRESPENLTSKDVDNSTGGILTSLYSISRASTAATSSALRKMTSREQNQSDDDD
ncbi:unnamed protein product [Adineta steineri]|uniref:Serine hydrolase domain-containing protein n=1 Tax=Adineta steineri TaxID=433720 RepID=A0A814ZV32_9BILA|nr:unnamed protein product [Adineta steineri]